MRRGGAAAQLEAALLLLESRAYRTQHGVHVVPHGGTAWKEWFWVVQYLVLCRAGAGERSPNYGSSPDCYAHSLLYKRWGRKIIDTTAAF